MRGHKMKKIIGAVLLCVAGTTGAQAVEDCALFMRAHGFASRAQFECGFSQYNEAVIAQARQCYPQLGEAKVKSNLMSGMRRFDEEARRRGKNKACAAVLKDFPTFVRR